MPLRINDDAPNFQAETTQGPIDFHQWIGDSWAILCSPPKDFTPVCTTELGYMARLAPDIVQAALAGLNLHALRGRQAVVPLEWEKQRRVFGFDVG